MKRIYNNNIAKTAEQLAISISHDINDGCERSEKSFGLTQAEHEWLAGIGVPDLVDLQAPMNNDLFNAVVEKLAPRYYDIDFSSELKMNIDISITNGVHMYYLVVDFRKCSI